MPMIEQFNPNAYGAEQIATALKKAYEGYSKADIDSQMSSMTNTISGLSDRVESATDTVDDLESRLLSTSTSSDNILSLTQEDLIVTGSGGSISLLSSGMIRVVKNSTGSTLRGDFTKVYFPRPSGINSLYLVGFTSIPEGITCSLLFNDKVYTTFNSEHLASSLFVAQTLRNAILRIEVDDSHTFSGTVLRPYCTEAGSQWTDSDWKPFFPSLTWLTSVAKEDSSDKILFEGSKNVLNLFGQTLTPSDSDVTAAMDNKGRITISKTGSSAGSLTISGISLKAGTYWFNVIGDSDAGVSVMESKLKDGDTEIAVDRNSGHAYPDAFTLETDKSGLSLVVEIAANETFDSILLLPYVSVKTGSSGYLELITWEPYYPALARMSGDTGDMAAIDALVGGGIT